jgi:predicted peptidase
MTTRRELLARFCALPAGLFLSRRNEIESALSFATGSVQNPDEPPRLAPGTPSSPERMALIESFRERSRGLESRFEARSLNADWVMPYRLFKPASSGRLPLVMYLHGSGGLGTDNEKQLGTGNVFGTRVWALPEHQERFPCYVVAPQTDRGWIRYVTAPGDSIASPAAGLGDGARLAFEVIDALRREFPIDEQRIYLTGQSMGGAGVWHMISQRPGFFAAAAVCCGTDTRDDVAASASTPIWNFHGDADKTVPVEISRQRISSLRKVGGRPIHTEYAGVDHNSWLWAYTEPALLPWVFGHSRRG